MRTTILTLLFAFTVAAQSATIKVDADGFYPIAVITLDGTVLGDCDDGDDDYRKLHDPTITIAMVYADSSMTVVSAKGPRLVQEFHIGKSPLYQLNAAWRI